MNGVLLIDKPEGITSAGVIRTLKPRIGRRTKIGHAGTLDPFASGLLPVCIGEATKIAGCLSADDKEYVGTIELGAETDTLDPTGRIVETGPIRELGLERLREVAARFTGALEQRPPMFSAVKRDGVPLYRLARRGVEVERRARRVVIASLELQAGPQGTIELSVRCSKGTYIRVLAADIARGLGTVGHLTRLRRVAVGRHRVEAAVGLETLQGSGVGERLPLVPIAQALDDRRRLVLGGSEVARLRTGQQGALATLAGGEPDEVAVVLDQGGEAVALVQADQTGRWRMGRLLNLPPSRAG